MNAAQRAGASVQVAEPKSTDPIVRMGGVCKSFGERTVLNGIDLEINQGEHVALIGPSGSGKTTVLRVLVGLERPDGGSVEIGGRSLWHTEAGGQANDRHLRDVRGQVGYVFQLFNLFPHMTAL